MYLFHSVREGRWRGTLKSTTWICSIQDKISCQRDKAGPLDISLSWSSQICPKPGHSPRVANVGMPPADLQLQAFSSCSCTSSDGASLLLPQSTASTAHTGHWTRKRCLEASSEAMEMHYRERHVRRGIEKKNIRVMLSLLPSGSKATCNLSQHELVLAAVFSPSHPGIWEPEHQVLPHFLRIHSEPLFENGWFNLTSSMWNYKPNT